MPEAQFAVQQLIRRRGVRRHAACAGALLVTCAAGGLVHMVVFLLAMAVFTRDTPSSLLELSTTLLLATLGGAAYGVLGVLPFNLVALRRDLNRSCRVLLLVMGVASLVCALTAGVTVTCLEGSQPSHPYLWITFLVVLVFGSPAAGIALGLVAVSCLVPRSWSPFPVFCCQSCGYDRRGLKDGAMCPECGIGVTVADTLEA